MTSAHPTNIELINADVLQIVWGDGQQRQYAISDLRDRCPCASCREKRNVPVPGNLLNVIPLAETEPLRITGMKPIGNYAYSIAFSDGHDTGIFTLELLREIGKIC